MKDSPSVFSSEEFKKLTKKKVPVMTEKELTKQICAYIKEKYPNVYFFTDPSGMFQKSWAAKVMLKNNRSKHCQLDLIILEKNKEFSGLIIELKREGEKLLNKAEEYKTPHLREQFNSIEHLRRSGYYACFGTGLKEVEKIIEKYMSNR